MKYILTQEEYDDLMPQEEHRKIRNNLIDAIEEVRNETIAKAIEAFKENCQNPDDADGCDCAACVRWVGGHCALLDGFVKRLNSKKI